MFSYSLPKPSAIKNREIKCFSLASFLRNKKPKLHNIADAVTL